MGSIRKRASSDFLFLDFRWNGKRCRETTDLTDNKANRKKAQKLLAQIEREIKNGTFDYERHFPSGGKEVVKKAAVIESKA